MRGKLIVLSCLFLLAIAQSASADLIGYWPLNEGGGTQVTDRSGSGHNGTIEGATWATPGWNGKGACLDFDGSNDLARVPDAADLVFASDDAYALTAWIYVKVAPGAWSGVVTKGRETGNWYGIWIDGSNAWVFGHQPNNQIGSTVVAGAWTHVAMVYDNGLKRIYLNGQLDDEVTAVSPGDGAGDLIFGAAMGVTEFAPVQLNEIRLYNHALTEAEVIASMESLAPPELASEPAPADEAMDIPRDIVLGWTPGQFAASHDVYFGTSFDDVNAASRSNPMDVLLSQGQSNARFEPGVLDFEQTYYWRVDEVNAAPDDTIYKGVVWSFTAEPFAYAVQNIIATSNGNSDAGQGPENTVNGSGLNAQGEHSINAPDMWLVADQEDTVYIQYEFDRVYSLHEMLVWNYNVQFELLLGFGVKDVTVEYSQDGVDWMTLGDVELAQATARSSYAANTTVDFAGVAARYVRLMIHTGFGGMGSYGLSEVRFMYIPAQAREPQPADGATDVSVDSALTWRAGRDATTHEVYFGTAPDALELAGTPGTASYEPGALQLDTTYYWQVDETSEALWTGDLWSFSTQEYIVVDGFESYNDDANRIYDTWIDGWINGTGSTVGHLEEPFAETAIVHGDNQSMPLFYDNAGVATSEAELVLGQDWTAYGIRSLSLYVRGDTDNNGGQLYVKINDTKVPYDGDASDINRAVWQPWNIDLSAVSGNLQNATKLTLGIEGAGAQGIVYINDIRLYPGAVEYITPAEPDSAALVAHYALEGNPNDSSGNGYQGTEIDGISYATGVDGQGVQLDGLYDYIDFGTPAGWPESLEPRTMTGWGLTETTDAGWRWIAAYGTGATSQAMFIGLNGPDLYGGGHGDDVMLADFWTVGEWHHIGLTYDGATARLYADGVEVAAEAKNWNLVPDRAHIGRQVSDQIEFWMGAVDEVRIYRGALAPGEIAWLAGKRAPVHKPF